MSQQPSSLSPKQRELLELVSTRFSDPETFDECHPALRQTGLYLTAEQLSDLRNAFFARTRLQQNEDFRSFDQALHGRLTQTGVHRRMDQLADAVFSRSFEEERREFAQLDTHLQEHGMALTREQAVVLREALLQCSREEQQRDFTALNDRMRNRNDPSLALSPETVMRLSDHLSARSRQEHVAEFERTTAHLQQSLSETKQEAMVLVPFVEDTISAPLAHSSSSELDAIPTPHATADDYIPLTPTEERNSQNQELRRTYTNLGIISRESDTVVKRRLIDRPRDLAKHARTPIGMFTITVALMLIGGACVLPSYLKLRATHKANAESIAAEAARAQSSGFDIQRFLTPDGTNTYAPTERGVVPTSVTAPSATAQSTNGIENNFLEFAQGQDTVPARIERIKALLRAKNRIFAQRLCVATMKRSMSKSEFAEVWSLMRQSMQI